MKIFKINENTDFNELCKHIGPRACGKIIMQKKSHIYFFYIEDIKAPAANILKQDALSIGAELVCNENVIFGEKSSNAVLMATEAQIEILTKKESMQDFGLKELGKFLKTEFKKPQKALIMGVVNVNNDSFNPASRVSQNEAIKRIEKFITDGADYIDLGGVSSRPGSEYCGRDEEFSRIKSVIDEIYANNLHEKVKFSLDSFDEYCLEYALNKGFKMINDISGKISLCSLAKKYDAEYCLMHMQGDPKNMQKAPKYDDLLAEIDEFFSTKLNEIAQNFGGIRAYENGEFLEAADEIPANFSNIFTKNGIKIFLDPGIGFGKSMPQNMLLIKHLSHFLHFSLPLFVGASHKQLINFYSPSKVEDRTAGSLYLHYQAFLDGATIIRTHDVYEHKQFFDMVNAMKNITI